MQHREAVDIARLVLLPQDLDLVHLDLQRRGRREVRAELLYDVQELWRKAAPFVRPRRADTAPPAALVLASMPQRTINRTEVRDLRLARAVVHWNPIRSAVLHRINEITEEGGEITVTRRRHVHIHPSSSGVIFA